MKNTTWVKCPACSEEWSKLRKCTYLSDDKKLVDSYLCVVCAETLVAWNWLIGKYPIPHYSELRWKKPRFLKYTFGEKIEKFDVPQHAYVAIDLGNKFIFANSNGTGTPIRFRAQADDKEHLADNIFEFRSKLIHTVPF